MRQNNLELIGFFLLVASFFLIIVSSPSIFANGGIFIDIDYDEHVYIPNQKAAIFWDGTNETMILSTKIVNYLDLFS